MPVLLAIAALAGGLHGTVTRGPTMPVCMVGVPCSKPAAGAVLVFKRGGHVAARVRVNAHGQYSLRLRPGRYAVEVSPRRRIGFGLSPRTVRVVRGKDRRVDFAIDTGIR